MCDHDNRSLSRGYHHGDLKSALLAEAEAILERDGMQALTLRAASRGAGVSHAAPANHFGDLTGLLSELAALGFRRFTASLLAARATCHDPHEQSMAIGRAYVVFARRHPGLFLLMFRSERLDPSRPALHDAMEGARQILLAASVQPAETLTPPQIAGQAAARWSLVHGFAMLLLDGRLDGLLPDGGNADSLLGTVLAMARFSV